MSRNQSRTLVCQYRQRIDLRDAHLRPSSPPYLIRLFIMITRRSPRALQHSLTEIDTFSHSDARLLAVLRRRIPQLFDFRLGLPSLTPSPRSLGPRAAFQRRPPAPTRRRAGRSSRSEPTGRDTQCRACAQTATADSRRESRLLLPLPHSTPLSAAADPRRTPAPRS